MDEQEKQRKESWIENRLFLEGKRNSPLLLHSFKVIDRHIQAHGYQVTDDLITKILEIFGQCRDYNDIVSYVEVSDILCCLSEIDPENADRWCLQLADWLCLGDGLERKATTFWMPKHYTRIMAGFILGLFKTTCLRSIYEMWDKKDTKFVSAFPGIIDCILTHEDKYPLWLSDSHWQFEVDEFKKFLSTVIKSELRDEFLGDKIRELYRNSLIQPGIESSKLRQFGLVLFNETFYALIGVMTTEERRNLLRPMPSSNNQSLSEVSQDKLTPAETSTEPATIDEDEETLATQSADPHLIFDFGIASKELTLYDKAIKAFNQAARLFTNHNEKARCLLQLGCCYKKKGDLTTALNYLGQALFEAYESKTIAAIVFEQATIFLANDQLALALVFAQKCKDLEPDYSGIKKLTAEIGQRIKLVKNS